MFMNHRRSSANMLARLTVTYEVLKKHSVPQFSELIINHKSY